jgi:hypothetical protein
MTPQHATSTIVASASEPGKNHSHAPIPYSHAPIPSFLVIDLLTALRGASPRLCQVARAHLGARSGEPQRSRSR